VTIITEWIDKTFDRIKIKIEGLEAKNNADDKFRYALDMIKQNKQDVSVLNECIPLYTEAIEKDSQNETAISNLINV